MFDDTITQTAPLLDVEAAVKTRYSGAARAPEASLCCPTKYDPAFLRAIPDEVLERDYGCGDPSKHLRRGETVLDLGSGSGKICFIASQVVGPEGRVVGVDMNDEMLALARRSAPEVARQVGHANVSFLRGRIQDLALDLEEVDRALRANPVRSATDLARLEGETARLRRERPLVADGSVDVVVSNCVLNLVRAEDKRQLFSEIFRVLRRGGRAVISDIVSDEDIPERLQRDPEHWSGCISGALREDLFLAAFEEAGFYGVTLAERGAEPWRTVEGIEFRSVTVVAYKGKEGPCLDQKHALVYRGPFREVVDDDGHVFRRGVRTAVCEKTFRIFSHDPYRAHVELVPPRVLVPLEEAPPLPLRAGHAAAGSAGDEGRGVPADHDGSARLRHRRSGRVLLMSTATARRAIPLPVVPEFEDVLRENGVQGLVRDEVRTLQVNVGRLCNMACHHCHVEAGPKRTERMPRVVAERVVEILAANPRVELLDLTGGAPEMNESFRFLVTEARRLGRRVIDRCNLTILIEPGMEDLAEFLAANEVHVVASLPCYQAENVDKQRGRGAFDKSILALRNLNALGYGRHGSALRLDLVYNPTGTSLPPPQARLEAKYREELGRLFGIEFHQLLTITNMPIRRFAWFLERTGELDRYMALLVNHFNPATVPELMCRSLLSVGWDGRLYDCDFNQMLEIDLGAAAGAGPRTVWDVTSLDGLTGRRIATGSHCFGCTAGAGSSCSGAIR